MITMRATDPDAAEIAGMLAAVPVCRHLNVSVLASDEEMASFAASGDTGTWQGPLSLLACTAWRTGNPGILFTGRIARDHPFDEQILACNPCAEQHLAAEEGCALASINLAALCHKSSFDWTGLREATHAAVRFLDDIIDKAEYPDTRTARRAAERRRVGVGVMGFATALHSLGIEYGSADSIALTSDFSATMRSAAHAESRYLASLRGAFPDAALDAQPRRNSHLLSIAPTGAISLLWNVSSGIEPYFDLKIAKESLNVSYDLGTQGRPKLARELPASRHIDILSAWQDSVDGGISKTVNLPEHSTPNDVCQTIASAWRSGCKGISVFRSGSRSPALRALS
jgi:ribonucleoside-diphosphate reductase alpha chain